MSTYKLKIVVIGDDYIGKTTLCWVKFYGDLKYDYVPTLLDSNFIQVYLDGNNFLVDVFDTRGSEIEIPEALTKLVYSNTDCFIICYSVVDHRTIISLNTEWFPKLKNLDFAHVPVVLCGTKKDLANQPEYKDKYCSPEQVKATIGREIEIVEVSALSEGNKLGNFEGDVDFVFETAIRKGFNYLRKSRKVGCHIL